MFTNKMKSLLFNLRCQSVKTIKKIHKYYNNYINCKICGTGTIDSQEYLLTCHRITSQLPTEMYSMWKTVKYQDIFGTPQEQYAVTKVCHTLLKIRLGLLTDTKELCLPQPL